MLTMGIAQFGCVYAQNIILLMRPIDHLYLHDRHAFKGLGISLEWWSELNHPTFRKRVTSNVHIFKILSFSHKARFSLRGGNG